METHIRSDLSTIDRSKTKSFANPSWLDTFFKEKIGDIDCAVYTAYLDSPTGANSTSNCANHLMERSNVTIRDRAIPNAKYKLRRLS
jgi:hypothetical protein